MTRKDRTAGADGPRAKPGADRPAIPLAEWLGAGAGALAALVLVGSLLYEALTHADTPPSLSVRQIADVTDQSSSGEGHRAVTFAVTNDGGRTAAEVSVVARFAVAGGDTRETRIVMDFVPRGSEREGTVLLPAGAGDLALDVAGYREP